MTDRSRASRRQILTLPLLAAAASPAAAQTPPAPAGVARFLPYGPGRQVVTELNRIVTPRGVQSLETVRLGGVDQWISIRGADRDNPLLLFVHGGPGSTEMGMSWAFQRSWEEAFTMVQWDQRGAGRTNRFNDQAVIRPTLSMPRIVDDGVELIDHLTQRFGRRKIVLLGHSWGSAVGLQMAMARPDKVHAYIGVGQLLDAHANEVVGYRKTLELARADNNAEAIRELEAIAPYPGELTPEKLATERKWSVHYGGLSAYRPDADYYFHTLRLSPDYEPEDLVAFDPGGEMSISVLLDEMLHIDLTGVRETAFPVVMFLGRHDLTTPTEVTTAWMSRLKAPARHEVWFENSAHLIPIEEPGRCYLALTQLVRPLAAEGEPRGGPLRL